MLQMLSSVQYPYTVLQYSEICLNQFAQKILHTSEPAWLALSAQLDCAQLMDVFVPLVGAFDHRLLVRLVCSLSVINVISSLGKWCLPTYRPYWWVREVLNASTLTQQHLTCETTAGFPSSHVISFTTFCHLLAVFTFTPLCRRWRISERYLPRICYTVTYAASICMWLSRLYIGAQFLHQCVLSALLSQVLLLLFDRYSTDFLKLQRWRAVLLVLGCGLLPVLVYFAMLRMDVDPHWSVRMAFKWCEDPTYLRHEASPIFVLARDFGYLMGVALSTPLYKRGESISTIRLRIPTLLLLELLNYYVRQETPKNRGRFIFVAYEFTRNMAHSYLLLNLLSKTK